MRQAETFEKKLTPWEQEHSRDRIETPLPHVTEQLLHGPHWPQLQQGC